MKNQPKAGNKQPKTFPKEPKKDMEELSNPRAYLKSAGVSDDDDAFKDGYYHPKGQGEGFVDDKNLHITSKDIEEVLSHEPTDLYPSLK